MFSMFLSSYRNTSESFGELEKAVETLASRLVFPQHFSFYQTFTCVSITRPYLKAIFAINKINYRQNKGNLIKLERKKGRTVYLPKNRISQGGTSQVTIRHDTQFSRG